MNATPWLVRAFLVIVFVSPGDGWAEAAPRGGGAAADPRLQMMVQQLTAEKVSLTTQKTRLEAEVEELKAQVAELEEKNEKTAKALQSKRRELGTTARQKDAWKNQSDELTERLETLVDRYQELAEAFKAMEGQRDEYIALAGDYDVRTAQCEANNESLYEVANELIDRYERKGFFTMLAQREPITRIKKAQIENLMDDYKQLIDEMRLNYPEILGDQVADAVPVDAGGGK